jgi:hypothetical protein
MGFGKVWKQHMPEERWSMVRRRRRRWTEEGKLD